MATRIKRYEDRFERYDALLARIEAEMGSEAELQTREFRRGALLGLFGGRRMVEVVATLQVELASAKRAAAVPGTLPPPAAPQRDTRDREAASQAIQEAAATAEATPVVPSLPPAPQPLKRGVDFTANEPVTLDTAEVAGNAAAAHQAQALAAARPGQPAAAAVREVKRETPPAPAAAPPQPASQPSSQVEAPPAAAVQAPAKAPAASDAAATGEVGAVAAELDELKHTVAELKQSIERLIVQQQPAGDAAATAASAVAPGPPASISAAPAAQPARSGSAAPSLPGTHQSEAIDTLMRAPLLAGVADPLALDHARGLDSLQRRVYDRLLSWNIGPYDALDLLNAALAGWQEPGPPEEPVLLKLIFREICSSILLSGGIKLRNAPPGKAVALVGATGVGKTTTIAKLAAYFAFQQNRRVSLVSLDNYRIAAAEQLRTYTEIMGIDLDIVFSRDEFDSVMTQRRQGDLVLIDTAGRSPLNQKQIYELRDIFSAHPPDEVHLVISASTKADDLRGQLENFKPLSYDHVIISKLDETLSLGSVYNLTRLSKTPISYFAIGQSVPEDLRPATLAFAQAWIEQGRIS